MPDQLTDRARKAAEEIARIVQDALLDSFGKFAIGHNVDTISSIIEKNIKEDAP